jgi:hypothetical protein
MRVSKKRLLRENAPEHSNKQMRCFFDCGYQASAKKSGNIFGKLDIDLFTAFLTIH